MCRWLAYSGSPILLKDALYAPAQLPRRPEPALEARAPSRRTATVSASAGTATRRHPGRLPQHRARLERPQPARAGRPHQLAACSSPTSARRSAAPCSRRTATPSATSRWLFMHNGYINEFATDQARPRARRRPVAVPEIEGQTDTEVLFFLALTFGLAGRPAGGDRAAIGLVEAVGEPARGPASVPGNGRDHRRREHLGVPVLQRGQVALALLHDGRPHAAQAVSRARSSSRSCLGRRAADRLRAARRRRRRLERGARGDLGRGRPRPRRDAAVPPQGALEVGARGGLTPADRRIYWRASGRRAPGGGCRAGACGTWSRGRAP